MSVSLRPFSFRDLSSTVQLINKIARAAGTGMTTFETAQRELARLPGRNLESDRFLAFEDDLLVGYGDVWRSPETPAADITIGVDPKWRGQGIGTALLDKVIQRASALQASAVNAYADPLHPEAKPFLANHGFSLAGYFRKLEHSAPETVAKPHLPAGYHLLPYSSVNRLALLQTAYEHCYQGMFGHKVPLEISISHLLDRYLPEHITMLFYEDDVIGVSCFDIDSETSTAYVDAPGLAEPHRKSELSRALTAQIVLTLRRAGCKRAEMLSWGDSLDTIRLYKNMGFRVRKEVPGHARAV